jgi:hypothetical protein
MDYPEFDAAQRLLISFMEEWNTSNPDRKLDKMLINKIEIHLRYAYVAGMDEYRIHLEKLLKKYSDKDGRVRKNMIIKEITGE